MKAAPMAEKPDFDLMKNTDVQNFYHMQMPRFLFFDGRYMSLSLEAKVAYTFLLNRFQLSKLNGWVNEGGEVFIIYTRKSLADEMQISYRKTISAMKELTGVGLVWEKRCGRGDANQIYLARVEADSRGNAASGGGSAPFVSGDNEAAGGGNVTVSSGDNAADTGSDARSAETALQGGSAPSVRRGSDESPTRQSPEIRAGYPDTPKQHFKKCGNGISRGADSACPEVPKPHTKKKDLKEKYIRDMSVSPARARESPALCEEDERELEGILRRCELWIFDQGTASVFENAVERLYYAEYFKVCGVTLPRGRIREKLRKLTDLCLQDAERKLRQNTYQKIRNTTAYVMSVVINSVAESQSDLMLDPYLNSLRASGDRSVLGRNL
jgi:hypothetical protein